MLKNLRDELNKINPIYTDEDDEVYRYSDLTDEDKIKLLGFVDFKLLTNEDGTYRLKDLQGGNLANIESEIFETIDDAVGRLETYWNDYHIYFV